MPKIVVDIMSRGRFICTMMIPSSEVVIGKEGGMPVIDDRKMAAYIESRRPSLKYIDYRVLL